MLWDAGNYTISIAGLLWVGFFSGGRAERAAFSEAMWLLRGRD